MPDEPYGIDAALIVWENGMPVPRRGKPYTKAVANAATNAALALPYEPVKKADGTLEEGEAKFIGMTNGEVMNIRAVRAAALGDLDAFKYLMDRAGGKAVQAVENVNVNASLADYLEAVAKQNQHYHVEEPVIPAIPEHSLRVDTAEIIKDRTEQEIPDITDIMDLL
jgi:hypothetical protein